MVSPPASTSCARQNGSFYSIARSEHEKGPRPCCSRHLRRAFVISDSLRSSAVCCALWIACETMLSPPRGDAQGLPNGLKIVLCVMHSGVFAIAIFRGIVCSPPVRLSLRVYVTLGADDLSDRTVHCRAGATSSLAGPAFLGRVAPRRYEPADSCCTRRKGPSGRTSGKLPQLFSAPSSRPIPCGIPSSRWDASETAGGAALR